MGGGGGAISCLTLYNSIARKCFYGVQLQIYLFLKALQTITRYHDIQFLGHDSEEHLSIYSSINKHPNKWRKGKLE